MLFCLYVVVLFYFLFFAERMGRPYSERAYHYNLVPFREIRRFLRYRDVIGMRAVLVNIVGNVAAFVPFGLFLPLLSAKCGRLWRTVFYSLELSLAVETLQLVLRVGTFDVDDLLLNTLGGMLGILLYRLLAACGLWGLRGEDSGGTSQKGI